MRTRRSALVLVSCLAFGAGACGGDPAAPKPAAPAAAPAPPEPSASERPRADFDTAPPYETIVTGDGAQVKVGDFVKLHYEAFVRSDGHLLDSSRRRNEPFVVEVGAGHVIRGWDLLLAKLRVGDRVKSTIPSDLAYGDRGIDGAVPPRADVVLDVEVLGIVPLPTWDVITKGEGKPVRPGSKVTVHYVSTLPDGSEFDNTRTRDQPFWFIQGAGQVIEGWDRVIVQMREGDKWKIHVPWIFAFGAEGNPPRVPGQTDLDFEIEVLSVE